MLYSARCIGCTCIMDAWWLSKDLRQTDPGEGPWKALSHTCLPGEQSLASSSELLALLVLSPSSAGSLLVLLVLLALPGASGRLPDNLILWAITDMSVGGRCWRRTLNRARNIQAECGDAKRFFLGSLDPGMNNFFL